MILTRKTRNIQSKKFEDEEVEALLNQDSSQTQEKLAESLNVDQSMISRMVLKAIGMIQKQEN